MPAGPYKSEAYGKVDVIIEAADGGPERVIGKASGGPCGFEPGTEVLIGESQGSVLVGELLLCQEGCEPAQERHRVLAIYNEERRVLSALVRLQKGCTSKALPDDSLPVVFQSLAPVEDDTKPREASPAAMPSRGGAPEAGGSATQVAKAQAKAPEVAPLDVGQRLLAERNYRQAQYQFANALQADRRSVTAQVGLAASLLGLNDVRGALQMLESIPRKSAEVHLWLAYAHQRNNDPAKAREFVGKLVGTGFMTGGRPMDAEAEQALQAEFNAVREQRRKQMIRQQAGPGSTRP